MVVFSFFFTGSIPACAGKPRSTRCGGRRSGVHPRVCGETVANWARMQIKTGPSPRVRGNHIAAEQEHPSRGSIPACAGKPGKLESVPVIRTVHPRVCGETRARTRHPSARQGPSPRVRGNQSRRGRVDRVYGSIPACAGKPRTGAASIPARRVHPRVCGETSERSSRRPLVRGPSPRVRGNRRLRIESWPIRRSIPACAGKPVAGRPAASADRVHPRVCGETGHRLATTSPRGGPSPRVRGNRQVARGGLGVAGSIPACAGKPEWGEAVSVRLRVHPRVCGETFRAPSGCRSRGGPSPRVRGNPGMAGHGLAGNGSIPACAGKPGRLRRAPSRARVHPRVCGETGLARPQACRVAGPSPRVRGNPHRHGGAGRSPGSIPACAGKP